VDPDPITGAEEENRLEPVKAPTCPPL